MPIMLTLKVTLPERDSACRLRQSGNRSFWRKIFSVAHIGATGLTAVSSALAHSQQNESVLLVTSAPEPPVSTANASGSPHCCAGRRRPSTIVAFGGHHLHMLHNGHLGLATSVSNSTPLDRGAQARHRRQNHMPLGGKQNYSVSLRKC